MRKIFNNLALIGLLTSSLLVASCQKDYVAVPPAEGQNPANTMRGNFKCYINGELYEAEHQMVTISEVDGSRTLSISATDFDNTRREEDFRTFNLTIGYYEGPKDYPISYMNKASYVRSFTDEGVTMWSYNPTDPESVIFITEDSDKVKGTFNVKIKPSATSSEEIVVSGGEFEIFK